MTGCGGPGEAAGHRAWWAKIWQLLRNRVLNLEIAVVQRLFWLLRNRVLSHEIVVVQRPCQLLRNRALSHEIVVVQRLCWLMRGVLAARRPIRRGKALLTPARSSRRALLARCSRPRSLASCLARLNV